MDFNMSRALASEVYLIENWNKHSGNPAQRRNEIFNEFVKLGMRGRWAWHARAETYQFSVEDRKILECRHWRARSIADKIGETLDRVVVTDHAHPMTETDLKYRTCSSGNRYLAFRYDGHPFDVLPELVYSMTAFDDPDDVAEARRAHRDQRYWVSGVFWMFDKIVWVDEVGDTIREKVCVDQQELKEADEAFARYQPFESAWWTEATKIGKYGEDKWWE
jgi:hypothetical protein